VPHAVTGLALLSGCLRSAPRACAQGQFKRSALNARPAPWAARLLTTLLKQRAQGLGNGVSIRHITTVERGHASHRLTAQAMKAPTRKRRKPSAPRSVAWSRPNWPSAIQAGTYHHRRFRRARAPRRNRRTCALPSSNGEGTRVLLRKPRIFAQARIAIVVPLVDDSFTNGSAKEVAPASSGAPPRTAWARSFMM